MFHHHEGGRGPRGRFAGWGRAGGDAHLRNVEDYFAWKLASKMGGGPRGRGPRMFDGGELRLVLLKLIADQPRHGYDLIRDIEERTGGAYAPSPGVVYPSLTMLADMGLIDEAPSEGARKIFAASEAGRAMLADKADEVAALLARLGELGAKRAQTDGGPVRRAMANLRAAIHDRLSAEGVSAETLHDVAELLDEVARKIERL